MSQPQKQQSYENHRQLVPVLHFFLIPLSFLVAVGAIVLAVRGLLDGGPLLEPLVILGLGISVMMIIPLSRQFALKVQDRLIRTEEELRHYKLTGQWVDHRITIKQLIALRFAGDKEFPALCQRAAKEQLSPSDIKKAVKEWRSDYYRV
jgi:hypothetical protein